MIHPDTELRFIGDEVGYGVFATALIRRGTITWVLDDFDILLSQEEFDGWIRFTGRSRTNTRTSTPRVCTCSAGTSPSTSTTPASPTASGGRAEFEVAVRDVPPGDELRCDYATLNLDQGEPFQCRCGARNCRGTIRPRRRHGARGRVVTDLRCRALTGRDGPSAADALLPAGRVLDLDDLRRAGHPFWIARSGRPQPPSWTSQGPRTGSRGGGGGI